MGRLPRAMLKVDENTKATGRDGIHGWRVQILPFIEQQSVFQAIAPMAAVPDSVKKTTIMTYRSPLDERTSAMTPYRVFVGNGAAFEPGKELRFSDFTDGLSNTILAVESAELVNWADGIDLPYDPNKPFPKLGFFPGGFNALMGDGSVRWIPEGTDEKIIRAMITRSGNEKVPPP